MQHLDERRMLEELLDGIAFTTPERDHLSLCAQCQKHHAMLTLMRDELFLARLSDLRPEAEAQLVSILAQVGHVNSQERVLPAFVGKMAEWARALPLWDSRQQATALGVRNGRQPSYRMLFGVDETEIELMVEPQGHYLRVVGEVMVAESQALNGLALIELAEFANAKIAIETESDTNGRFSLEQVPPGTYVMTITPRYSQMFVIEPLELT